MTPRLLTLAQQLDQATLRQVFTHTSWAPDRASSYERLEFLGDSVLELATARALYERRSLPAEPFMMYVFKL